MRTLPPPGAESALVSSSPGQGLPDLDNPDLLPAQTSLMSEVSGHQWSLLLLSLGKRNEREGKRKTQTYKGTSERQKKEKSWGFISGSLSCLLSASLRYSKPFTSSPTITEEAFN